MWIFGSVTAFGLVLSISAGPGTTDRLLLLGDSLLASGMVEEAVTEYKRYIFFARDLPETRASYAYARAAVAYRSVGRHEDAVDMLLQAIATETREADRDGWRIDLGVTEIARGRYDLAEFTLLKVEMFSRFAGPRRRAAFFRGICNLYVGRLDEARAAFRTYADGSDAEAQELGERIENLLDRAARVRAKSPRVARALSSVVPGLGEAYAGEWRGGLSAFATNALAGFVLLQDVLRRQVADALVGSMVPFARFYKANRDRAVAAAQRFNARRGSTLVAEILAIVEKK